MKEQWRLYQQACEIEDRINELTIKLNELYERMGYADEVEENTVEFPPAFRTTEKSE